MKTHSAVVPCCCLRPGTVTSLGNHQVLEERERERERRGERGGERGGGGGQKERERVCVCE